MKMLKKIIALGLISGSAILVVLIVKESGTKVVGNPAALNLPSIKSETEIPETGRSENLGNNSTEEIAQKVAAKIAPIKNAEDLKKLEPEKLVDQILTQELTNFDPQIFSVEVKTENLKIAKVYDPKSKSAYFQNLKAITQNDGFKINIAAENPAPADFQSASQIYRKTIANLYNLVVPESLVEFHREIIRIFLVQQNIFEALANYETDPLKAMVSLGLLEETEKQLASIQKKYAQ